MSSLNCNSSLNWTVPQTVTVPPNCSNRSWMEKAKNPMFKLMSADYEAWNTERLSFSYQIWIPEPRNIWNHMFHLGRDLFWHGRWNIYIGGPSSGTLPCGPADPFPGSAMSWCDLNFFDFWMIFVLSWGVHLYPLSLHPDVRAEKTEVLLPRFSGNRFLPDLGWQYGVNSLPIISVLEYWYSRFRAVLWACSSVFRYP